MDLQSGMAERQLGSRKSKIRRLIKKIFAHRALYIMMFPALAYYFVFRYMPIYGLSISFKDFNPMIGIEGSPWANPLFKHFSQFINSPYFLRLLGNTVTYENRKNFFGRCSGKRLRSPRPPPGGCWVPILSRAAARSVWN